MLQSPVALPVNYKTSKNAWVTTKIFSTQLHNWGLQLGSSDTHILLLKDNCSAHPQNANDDLRYVRFCPPSTTSELQPSDAGSKTHYRCCMSKLILNEMSETDSTMYHNNQLDRENMSAGSCAEALGSLRYNEGILCYQGWLDYKSDVWTDCKEKLARISCPFPGNLVRRPRLFYLLPGYC